MKKNRPYIISFKLWFFLVCLVGLALVSAIGYLSAWALVRWMPAARDVPVYVWAIIICIFLGVFLTVCITKIFFDPIAKLRRAMGEVAGGDFKVFAETNSHIADIQSIYDDFNAMVRELDATETLQTDFISSVSHEFKTPIGAIEGYAMLLQDKAQSEEERAECVDKILYNTERLSNLVGNILLLSKVTNQSISMKREAYRLDEQVRQAVVELERKWTERETELDVDLEEIEYVGHEGLMLHVFSNLIDNAVKFAPVGGIVRMRLKTKDGAAVFTIDDNGPGINEGDADKIFGKFYQGDTSHKTEGNGLGLALVRRIVAMHGGTVSVENLTVGCRFTVTLPMEE